MQLQNLQQEQRNLLASKKRLQRKNRQKIPITKVKKKLKHQDRLKICQELSKLSKVLENMQNMYVFYAPQNKVKMG